MPRSQTRYVCGVCGHVSPNWVGRCPECDSWSSLAEEAAPTGRKTGLSAASRGPVGTPLPVTSVPADAQQRCLTGIGEMDRVLGGGIVPGAVVLVGGDPGIGKSTLLTQVAHRMAASTSGPALYVSGEESPRQIRLRCERLGALSQGILVVGESDLSAILTHASASTPSLVVVDSIQTTYDSTLDSAPGTVSQVRSVGSALAQWARDNGIPVFLIGHVTKEGSIAGPRVLEHLVDTVLYFEGDRHHAYRVLRAVKNRFGSTDEIGLFEMRESGLQEVTNVSAALLSERRTGATGSVVAATVEGSRPLLVEVQALVTRSFLASPRRVINGFDPGRANMVLAVLEKRLGMRLGEQDVFVNVAGGVRLVEPAADLALAVAVASSFREDPCRPEVVVVGEIGLGGEVRAVSHIDRRLREAARLGFRTAVVPRYRSGSRVERSEIMLQSVETIQAALAAALARTVKDA